MFRNDDFVVRSACEFESEVCVITFDSYSDDRSLDRSGFAQDFFISRRTDAIHFISRENDWYQYPELPTAAAEVAARVGKYRRVVAYGSSMGGYGAIRFGGMAGARAALAISPQFSIDPLTASFERRWKYDSDRIDFSVERTLEAPFVSTAYIVYDPCDLDRRHVDLFRRRTRVIDVRLPDVGHPATGSLAEAGLLSELVMDFVGDAVDAARVARRVADARESSSQFHYVMSTRAFTARSRIRYADKAATMAPRHFGFVAHYASLLAASGRFSEAGIAFARAAAISPDHPVLLYKLTEFHERRGDLEGAIEAAERLVALHSETYRPRLEQLLRLRSRPQRHWPALRIGGRRFAEDPALSVDIGLTTTPSPPPFADSWRMHEALVASRPAGPVDVFLVGDALAEFWPADLWAPLSVFNFGVRADKTQHALWRLGELPADAIDCRHAVVLVGANNLGANDTARGIAAGVAAVVAGVVRVAPKASLWVIAMPPCGAESRFRAEVWRESNRILASLKGFATLDVGAALTDGSGLPSYETDGIHLTRAGYERLTQSMMGWLE